MSQQVYNVTDQSEVNVVSNISPVATVLNSEYLAGDKNALEYSTSTEAASIATYLNSMQDVVTYVVVGPHPKPHH